jgi:sortase A
VDALIRFLRTKKWARRAISGFSIVLLVVAAGLLGYPVYTNYVHNRLQGHLSHQLASPSLANKYRAHQLREGDSLTRIKIPKLGVDVVVVQGTSESALRAGAGHYPGTPLPCDIGNVAIAGHRTTYGKPFANIDQLVPGDQIILTTPIGSCSYQVSRPVFVVSPTDGWVVANTPGEYTLTLTSCHPKGSAANRIVAKATMISQAAA